MTLIELLIFALLCGLLVLVGRFFFGLRGWLLGVVPLGLFGLLLLFGVVKNIFRELRKLISRVQQRRKKADLPIDD